MRRTCFVCGKKTWANKQRLIDNIIRPVCVGCQGKPSTNHKERRKWDF